MLIMDSSVGSACFRDSAGMWAPLIRVPAMYHKHGVRNRRPHLRQLCVWVDNGAELHSLQLLYPVSMVPWS